MGSGGLRVSECVVVASGGGEVLVNECGAARGAALIDGDRELRGRKRHGRARREAALPRHVEIGGRGVGRSDVGARWCWVEMVCLRLRVRMALGDARAATQGASGKWDFDKAIDKYIDLSYHDKKGGDSSTAVRRWRMF